MTAAEAASLEPFLIKLERRTPLAAAQRAALLDLPAKLILAEPNTTIDKEDAPAVRSIFVISGYLTRRKTANGVMQIVALCIPGDAADMQSLWFKTLDHTLYAQTASVLLSVDHDDMIRLCERQPHLAHALWHDTLVDASIFRQWTLNIAHRRARARIAHMLLETIARMKAHKLIGNDIFELPLTQSEMASALGLSLVHLNKSLASLRREGLIEVNGRCYTVLNRERLEALVGFDPAYLHLDTPPKAALIAELSA